MSATLSRATGAEPLPCSVHAWHGSGAVATSVFNTVPGLLLLVYLTDTLAVSGYVESGAGEAVRQSGEALRGMLVGSTLVPAAVMLCCLVPLPFYRLTASGPERG